LLVFLSVEPQDAVNKTDIKRFTYSLAAAVITVLFAVATQMAHLPPGDLSPIQGRHRG
jgi:hypothetical protein